MEREIKFRGMTIDSHVFVYGVFSVVEDRSYIVQINDGFNGTMKFIPVDAGTVCQFTGFKDRNGMEIFEGDAFRYYSHKGYLYDDFTGYVNYKYGSFGFSVDELGDDHFTPFCNIGELQEDFLNYVEITWSIHDNTDFE